MARPTGRRRRTTKTWRPISRSWLRCILAPVVALGSVGVAVVLAGCGGSSRSSGSAASAGLPDTPDYHSLLVDPADPDALTLGTHAGLFTSGDGGRSWRPASLPGQDAMNLVRTHGALWVAGHSVLARSADGGTTWQNVRPRGLPSLDVHGFAASPGGGELVAAVAGEGLYRSTDGGKSFTVASRQVGGSVFGLAVMPSGEVLAADTSQGLLASAAAGDSWRRLTGEPVLGVAINPKDPRTVLATGKGIYRSGDAGRTWTRVRDIAQGAGPVAWSPSAAKIAYVVGFDRTLYRTDDGGTKWLPVGRGT